MTADEGSRRSFLKAAGAAGATALVAGCSGNGESTDGEDETENGNEDDGGSDGYNIDPGTQIELDGQTAGWEGIAPGDIEGEQNPTLILQEGEDYEIGWTQGDGSQHNIEIRNDGGDVVDDLSTDQVAEPEDQWLEFTASSEMANYVCNPHETTMIGEIVVE